MDIGHNIADGYKYTATTARIYADVPLQALGLGLSDFTIDLRHPWPIIISLGSFVAYISLIAGWRLVWPPKPENRGRHDLGFTHHVLLCLYSLFACSAALYYLFSSGEIFNFNAYMCTPVPAWLRLVSLTFTVSKIWEWRDTTIMLDRGDSLVKIGFLHLYHHCTTFVLFLLIVNTPSTEKSGLFYNGFVHTLMYAHYAWRLPKPFRPVITAAQIVQLAVATWMWHISPATCPAFASFPAADPIAFIGPYALVPVYLAFFLQFFVTTYILAPSKPAGGAIKTRSGGGGGRGAAKKEE